MVLVEVFCTSNKKIGEVQVDSDPKVLEIKKEIAKILKLSIDRQSIRSEAKGKDITDDTIILSRKIYVKDLGPQIDWNTVFFLEYFGPLILYGVVALRPSILYENYKSSSLSTTARLAFLCWSGHYLKRILETFLVHRFSHGTMPIRNLFKNCCYYWGFTLYVAYHVNHPLFTPPPIIMQIVGLAVFIVSEVGNLSIHLLLRDLRPPGTKVRKIPLPNSNPLTNLYKFVSCPNYTYEFYSWIGFSLLTSCIPAVLFTLVGFYQMTIWALNKHRNYKNEFPDYPKRRKAILPFII